MIPARSLSVTDRQKLVAVLNLLSSDQLGERTAAGLTAARLMRSRGATWADHCATAWDGQGRPIWACPNRTSMSPAVVGGKMSVCSRALNR